MNSFNTAVNFFKDGGLFLYPLALIFVVGVAIAIERFVYLTRETARNRSLWNSLVPPLGAGNFKQVAALTQTSKASIATDPELRPRPHRARQAARRCRESDGREPARGHSAHREAHALPGLSRQRRASDRTARDNHRPDYGAFSAVASANPAEKASLLSLAISVAMNNTASGLGVAITLLLSHMFLESKTTSLIDSLEIASLKFLNAIVERPVSPAVPTAPSAAASQAHPGPQARSAK